MLLYRLGDSPERGLYVLLDHGDGSRAAPSRHSGVNCELLFASAQSDQAVLDQVNLRLPRSLAGRGETGVVLKVEGKPANLVTVDLK